MSRDNIIYIGKKPAMTYVMAVIATMNKQDGGVILKARGQAITTAVNVVEICRNRYLQNLGKPMIEIGTEELENQHGGVRNVSTMSITLSKEGIKSQTEKPKKVKSQIKSKIPVTKIKGVGKAISKKLEDAGYKDAELVAKTDPDELAEKAGVSPKMAVKIIEAAKNL
jgi:DNA-binding protein